MRRKLSIDGQIWSHVIKTDNCWLWTGWRTTNGYGAITRDNKTQAVHRFVYKLLVGPIPAGLTLHHKCKTRNCVNPKHLVPLSMRDNTLLGNAVSAVNARKEQCPDGHPYTPIKSKPGWRECRVCILHNQRRRLGIKPENYTK